MTLKQAFELGDDQDDERAIRSVALLLEWASDAGNKDVDGFLAQGLSHALTECATKVSRLFTCEDVWKSGGDPRKVRPRL